MQTDNLTQIKNELQAIISGIGSKEPTNFIEAAARYLTTSQGASKQTQATEFAKQKEATLLELFATANNFWVTEVDEHFYLSEGAEQKVYFLKEENHVIKLNDSIFYTSWFDYLVSLTLHNYFFPTTNYELIGFYKKERLYAVVKQAFVISTEETKLDGVKEFLQSAGFSNKRNNDYFSDYLGIIVEDLHDENVLTNQGTLFFIDTVFYLTEKFYK